MKSMITLSAIPILAALALVGCGQNNSNSSTDTMATNSNMSDATNAVGGTTNMPPVNSVPMITTNMPATNSVEGSTNLPANTNQ